jgi:hypothetical protein
MIVSVDKPGQDQVVLEINLEEGARGNLEDLAGSPDPAVLDVDTAGRPSANQRRAPPDSRITPCDRKSPEVAENGRFLA